MKVKCSGLDLCDAVGKVIKATSVKSVNGILEDSFNSIFSPSIIILLIILYN